MIRRVSVSSNTSSFASGGSPSHSTVCVSQGLGGFSMYCITSELGVGHACNLVLPMQQRIPETAGTKPTVSDIKWRRQLLVIEFGGCPGYKKEPVLVRVLDRNES